MTGQVDFNSHTDSVTRVTVSVINVLTPGTRRGRPYTPPAEPAGMAAAASEGVRAVYPSHRDFTGQEAAELAGVAARLRHVFEAVAGDDIDTAAGEVNRLLDDYQARPRLDRHDGEPWHVHFHGAGGTVAAEWGGSCATALAVVLGSEFNDRLGVCTAPACDRVYVDVSRNGTKRFCSTACQNRVKTAAFRARAKA